MWQLLAADGNLICMEFPSTKDPKIGGPPHALPPSVYIEHLAHPGKGLPYDDDTGYVKEGVSGPNSPAALTRVAHWQPERTHAIGKDANGKVMDWVSIWRY